MNQVMKAAIEDNMKLGGNMWKEYTKKELIYIYGYLPDWFVEKDKKVKVKSKKGV